MRNNPTRSDRYFDRGVMAMIMAFLMAACGLIYLGLLLTAIAIWYMVISMIAMEK